MTIEQMFDAVRKQMTDAHLGDLELEVTELMADGTTRKLKCTMLPPGSGGPLPNEVLRSERGVPYRVGGSHRTPVGTFYLLEPLS